MIAGDSVCVLKTSGGRKLVMKFRSGRLTLLESFIDLTTTTRFFVFTQYFLRQTILEFLFIICISLGYA